MIDMTGDPAVLYGRDENANQTDMTVQTTTLISDIKQFLCWLSVLLGIDQLKCNHFSYTVYTFMGPTLLMIYFMESIIYR